MRIAYLSDSYFPSQSANSVHVIKMCEAFADCGHQVFMIGLRGRGAKTGRELHHYYGTRDIFSIRLNRIPPVRGALFLHALINLWRLLVIKPDLIIGRSFLSIALSTYFFRKPSVVFETHSPYAVLNFYQRKSFDRIIRKARMIIVISEALRRMMLMELKDRLTIPVLALHDGATLGFTETPPVVLESKNSNLNVGYIGTVVEGRGIELIVDLSRLLPDYNFHIIGGTALDLETMLGISKIPENVYCYGYVNPGEVAGFRDQMDVLLAPYQEKVFVKSGKDTSGYMSPLKIFEYMAGKKAIIASDLPVLCEVLNDRNAILVNPQDREAWKAALLLFNEKDYRERLGEQAFRDLTDHFTWKKRAEKILEII